MCRLPVTSLLVFLCLVGRSRCSISLQDSMAELHARFAVSFYQMLTERENNSNLIVSPLSVSVSLGLLQLGGRGNTLAQLEGTLGYHVNDAPVRDFLLRSHGEVGNSSQDTWLQQTCTLFIQNGVQILTRFTQQAATWANASLIQANRTHSQLERRGQTHGSGEGSGLFLLDSGMKRMSRGRCRQEAAAGSSQAGGGEAQAEAVWGGQWQQMVLVNTVSFGGIWQKPFVFTNTQNLPFFLHDGKTVKVPMMHQNTEAHLGQFRTASDQHYTVLELPYTGRSLSLQVVLPGDRKHPLSSLESQLNARQLAAWDTGLRPTKMDVFLPRFKIQNKFNLRSVLPSMGISDAFNPTAADFTGISAEGLYVSDAFHEVRIEVTENGTKAAAATAMVHLKRSRAPVFKADRPFLFLLRHVNTGSILFMGRVMNPAEQTA
ncbi:hypothetical protein LDENG_00022830 [Lucifuga dentata]|nr:hypothetical protein LDENG_00022830 [Lucifuga dentata]